MYQMKKADAFGFAVMFFVAGTIYGQYSVMERVRKAFRVYGEKKTNATD